MPNPRVIIRIIIKFPLDDSRKLYPARNSVHPSEERFQLYITRKMNHNKTVIVLSYNRATILIANRTSVFHTRRDIAVS